jgi:Icc-related predicted phosphoesterase
MRLHLISDLHLDHEKEHDDAFLRDYRNEDQAELVVVAGDAYSVCNPKKTGELLKLLRTMYDHVVLVPGNHDLWLATPEHARREFENCAGGDDNVHVFMEPSFKEIGGVLFFGGTMWYPQPQPRKKQDFIDFRQVLAPRSWFFTQHRLFKDGLFEKPLAEAVVVSHHLPHPESTPAQFRDSPTDHFFMTNMTNAIMKTQPKLWLHGHTHDPCDYKIGATRIACNPRGYPFEYRARDPYKPKLIEV